MGEEGTGEVDEEEREEERESERRNKTLCGANMSIHTHTYISIKCFELPVYALQCAKGGTTLDGLESERERLIAR